MRKILVTGSAGFVGFHVSRRLLDLGHQVIGLDNVNDYYSVQLKTDRLAQLTPRHGFRFQKLDLADLPAVARLFEAERFEFVVHLAAQVGVHYSMINPAAYINSNIVGFSAVLEGCRNTQVQHLLYASSSSVYGANTKLPFSVHDPVDHPLSLYAATKRADELMAHAYSHLYRLPTTGLRLFTAYGPWGRPDMALHLFTRAILAGEPINVYNQGRMQRDFTYIDDVVEGIVRLIDHRPQPDSHGTVDGPGPDSSRAPFKIYNLGNHRPVELIDLIETLERCLGVKAKKNLLPLQPVDVPETFADMDELVHDVGFKPFTPIEEGVARFVDWYRSYHRDRPDSSA